MTITNKTAREVIKFTKKKSGSLVIIGMPIGNFDDLTPRALSGLKNCSLVLCEDTRASMVFFKYFGITAPLVSYVGNYDKSIKMAVAETQNGLNVGLICDRGMVGISDPGAKVVAHLRKENIKIECMPGVSSLTTAFSLSGYFGSFIFHGFLPRKKNETTELLKHLGTLDYNLVFFESALRLQKSLEIFDEILPGREITIARELTKPYEEIIQGYPKDLKNLELKGELVLILKKN